MSNVRGKTEDDNSLFSSFGVILAGVLFDECLLSYSSGTGHCGGICVMKNFLNKKENSLSTLSKSYQRSSLTVHSW